MRAKRNTLSVFVTFSFLCTVALAADIQVLFKQPEYYKVSADGVLLSNKATEWDCVYDATNKNLWEIKTSKGGVRKVNKAFQWGGTGVNQFGFEAIKPETRNVWTLIGIDDWHGYGKNFYEWDALIEEVERVRLCGASGWIVPDSIDLASLSSYYYGGRKQFSKRWAVTQSFIEHLYINTEYFSDMKKIVLPYFWSSNPSLDEVLGAWQIYFGNGKIFASPRRDIGASVRLVVKEIEKGFFKNKPKPSSNR